MRSSRRTSTISTPPRLVVWGSFGCATTKHASGKREAPSEPNWGPQKNEMSATSYIAKYTYTEKTTSYRSHLTKVPNNTPALSSSLSLCRRAKPFPPLPYRCACCDSRSSPNPSASSSCLSARLHAAGRPAISTPWRRGKDQQDEREQQQQLIER